MSTQSDIQKLQNAAKAAKKASADVQQAVTSSGKRVMGALQGGDPKFIRDFESETRAAIDQVVRKAVECFEQVEKDAAKLARDLESVRNGR